MATLEKIDAVIVGGGMVGSMMAAKLAQAGKKVVVLEQGPAWKQSDLQSSSVWGRRHRWSGPRVQPGGSAPLGYQGQSGWGFGGSGIHYYAQWLRLKPEDFQSFAMFGRSVDWPFTYDELRPFYDSVQAEVGISGDEKAEVWRPAGDPYPLPPIAMFRQQEVMKAVFEKAGQRVAPMPLAILSRNYKGRPACIYDGWCDVGCPTGALMDPLAVYIPQAQKAGATFKPHSWVSRVVMDNRGKNAVGVEYFDERRVKQVQPAGIVILAGNPVQNARLLLASAGPNHDKGLSNRSDLVGRFFMGHLGAGFTMMFDEDLQNHLGVTASSLISQDGYAKNLPGKPFGSHMWVIANARKPVGNAFIDQFAFGEDLHKLMQNGKGLAGMLALGEQLPRPENRIELSPDKDAFGGPIAKTTHNANEDDQALYEYTKAEGKRILKDSGATRIWEPGPLFGGQHYLGGTRMGKDAATSVCNGYGQTHEIGNLVLTGGGMFPTIGATHPTYTIHALTARQADYLARNWGAIAA